MKNHDKADVIAGFLNRWLGVLQCEAIGNVAVEVAEFYQDDGAHEQAEVLTEFAHALARQGMVVAHDYKAADFAPDLTWECYDQQAA